MKDVYKIRIGDKWFTVDKELSDALANSTVQEFAIEKVMSERERSQEMLDSLQKYFDETPLEQLQKEWKEISDLHSEGVGVNEYFENLEPNRPYRILDYISETSIQLFGDENNPLPNLHHLKKEVKEAIENPKDIMEYVDCLILLAGAYRRAKIGQWRDLFNLAVEKSEINKTRKWGEPDENGARQHID